MSSHSQAVCCRAANLGLFSPERPLALFYVATYVVVGLGLAWVLWDQRDLTG